QGVELRHRRDLEDRLDVVDAVDPRQHEPLLGGEAGGGELLHGGGHLGDGGQGDAGALDLLADAFLGLAQVLLGVRVLRLHGARAARRWRSAASKSPCDRKVRPAWIRLSARIVPGAAAPGSGEGAAAAGRPPRSLISLTRPSCHWSKTSLQVWYSVAWVCWRISSMVRSSLIRLTMRCSPGPRPGMAERSTIATGSICSLGITWRMRRHSSTRWTPSITMPVTSILIGTMALSGRTSSRKRKSPS